VAADEIKSERQLKIIGIIVGKSGSDADRLIIEYTWFEK